MLYPPPTQRKKPGIIVGFAGATRIDNEPVFEGIAVMTNSRGQDAFVAVFLLYYC